MSTTMSLQVERVRNEREIEQFIRFGWEVYQGNPLWVPPNVSETRNFLAGKGLFFEHCRHALFVAKENSKIVATAAAFYDNNLVAHWDKKVGLIGYFEALPDKFEAVQALFAKLESYLKSEGAEIIRTPVNGSIANPAGLLLNSFNETPVFLMMYNPSYYRQYFRRLSYEPIKDLLAFTVDLLDGRLRRKSQFILKRAQNSEVRTRPFDRKRFEEESDLLARIYSETFKAHWGYAPQSEEEFYEILSPFKLALESDFIQFAEHEGKVVGFALGVPDYNPTFRRLNGNFDFLNVMSFLYLKRKIREGRLIAIGVVPEWRGKRIAPLLLASVFNAMMERGYIKCEYSWVFRENVSSQNVVRKFYSSDYKHYCVFEKKIA